jgi:hypothetical protein
MNTTERMVKEIAFRTFISVVCCTLFGYLSWKGSVFYRFHTAFQYISYGTIGALFFYTLRINLKNAILTGLIAALIFSVLVTRAHGLGSLRDLFAVIASISALYFYSSNFYCQTRTPKFAEPLLVAVLFMLVNVVALVLLVALSGFRQPITLLWLYEVAKQYFLTGLGIGIGIILTEEPYSGKIRSAILNLFSLE